MRRVVVRVIAGLVAARSPWLPLRSRRPGTSSSCTPSAACMPVNIEGDRGFLQTVGSAVNEPVIVFDEFLDSPRFGGPAYESTVARYLREKYASRPPDVIVAVGEDALRFILRHRAETFGAGPGGPRGRCEDGPALDSPLPADVVGVPVRLRLLPHHRPGAALAPAGSAPGDRDRCARDRPHVGGPAPPGGRPFRGPCDGRVSRRACRPASCCGVWRRWETTRWCSRPATFQDGAGRNLIPRESVAAMAAASTRTGVRAVRHASWAPASSAATCRASRRWAGRRDRGEPAARRSRPRLAAPAGGRCRRP